MLLITWYWTKWTICWIWVSLQLSKRYCNLSTLKVISTGHYLNFFTYDDDFRCLLLRSSTVAVIAVVFSDRDLPPQTLLFSATCPSWVYKTAEKYMRKEQTAHVDTIGSSVNRTSTTVEHLAIRCQYHDRAACIGMLLLIFYPVTAC